MPAFSAAPVVDNLSPDISQIISLVDKIVVEQPPDQGAAAVHLQLTSRLGSQLADAAATSLERTVVFAHRGR